MVRNEEKVGTLEDEAVKRRQRLNALKKRRNKDNGPEPGDSQEKKEGQEEEDESLPSTQVLFRNYKPKSDNLEGAVMPSVEPADVEDLVRDQIEDGEKAKEEVQVEISNLAPKKITFDLKRGIQSQLDKLERRTDKAIAELIRQRLKEGKQQDFLIAVNAGAQVNRRAGFDSDED
ncbi:coiled-coil domain-containing protein 12-like [Palaemon carinicauda]|uniref:coiled-coil domain-containing protein 12-like n=1 Tax=Palaemon carinicauda TaxID=392227 RepID=UPI0035B68262